jgi:serine/threonine protein phosphatase 1
MIAVIGDIHGCYFTLKNLIAGIKEKYPGIKLFSVGDIVDRGKHSFEAFELVISENIKFTPGNHDYMFYHFIHHPESEIGQIWIYNGSEPTINSYSNRVETMYTHLDIIIKAPLFFNMQDCFISHAGISTYFKSRLPRNVLDNEEQLNKIIKDSLMSDRGILWTRDSLLDIGKLQVVGHTRQREVVYQQSNNVVYVDTSVYTGNKMSAVIVERNKVLDTISVPTEPRDIK